MALLTHLSEGDAARIFSSYGLTLETLRPLPAHGTVNSNFRARASGADWFLRVNEGKQESDVAAEAALVVELAARGVPTPCPVRATDGRWYASLGEKWLTLFPWVAGREARPLERVAVAGEALARIHVAARSGGVILPRNHYTLDELERRLATFDGDARFSSVVPALAAELAAARVRARGPVGLIHQDLFPDNLLVDDRGELAAILDFEQTTSGSLIYDLAVALNAWCWDGETIVTDAATSLLAAYEAVAGPIVERALLDAECRLAAARFTITRITDVYLPKGVDEDLRRRKDWRDYAGRLRYWTLCQL